MAYQVLARKWRPHRFEEMVGQEHVLKALMNALDKGRLHHAYLFTGTRGVGKTTIARILARSLNCEEGVSAQPCGQCSACQQINEGRFVDLIEVDAASRTKVDDTRELLDNVQYKPTVGRYKVYLIDEVHMLSNHSFNALLKTLEEPPEHVKFLLATTDPQKLPVTVLSRCLQFNLKRVPEELIMSHMADLLGREDVPHEEAALRALAQAADGSIRDGLSLLDQAIAFGDGKVNEGETVAMLGTISRQYMQNLVAALATGEAEQVMQVVEQLAEFSPDFKNILDSLITFFHDIALAQMAPSVLESRLADVSGVMELSRALEAEDVQLWYEIAVHGMGILGLSSNPRVGFEMVLLRMLAFRPQQPEEPDIAASGEAKKKRLSSADTKPVPVPEAEPQPPAKGMSVRDRMAAVQAVIKGGDSAEVRSAETKANAPASQPVVSPVKPIPEEPHQPKADDNNEMPPWVDEEPPWPEGVSDVPPVEQPSGPAAEPLPVSAPVERTGSPQTETHALLEEVIEDDDWGRLLVNLDLPPMVRELASNCRLERHDGSHMVLRVSQRHETLKSETNTRRLQQVLSQHYGEAMTVEYMVENEVVDTPAHKAKRRASQAQLKAEVAIENDRVVQSLKEHFDAVVVPGSVRPLN